MSISPSTRSGLSQSSSNINIQKLFDYNRIAHHWDLIPLIIYFPFGLCLCIIRLFIGIHAFLIACLLPKASSIRCFILRTMCAILGIVVKEIDAPSVKTKSTTKIIVSNHVTNFDHVAIDLVLPCIVPGVWDLPKFLNWGLGFHDFGVHHGRDVLIENVKRHLNCNDNSLPILTHPEGATTNGRSGLLKFSTWPFTLDTHIQPIFITLNRPPPIKIMPSVLGSRWWTDLFWFLFVPFTIFNIRYLSVVKRNENETVEDFAKRVQHEIARSMCITATNFTDSDKVEFAKRLFHVSSQTNTSSSSSSSSLINNERIRSSPNTVSVIRNSGSVRSVSTQLEQMTLKVKEVLPQVPLIAIQKDLAVTANIDETITRILEGTVTYIPEQSPRNDTSSLSISNSQSSGATNPSIDSDSSANSGNLLSDNEIHPSLNTAAKTFGKSAGERTKSYHERKAALIANSRLIYIKKHALNLNETH